MNEHREWSLLSAYLDGELTPSERSLVGSHLVSCGDCRQEMERLARIKSRLFTAPRRGVPPELMARLELSLRPSSWQVFKAWIRLPRVWIPAGTVTMAVLFLGLWVGVRNRSAQELPLEALLAAHSRYSAEGLVPQGGLATSNFSSALELYHGDEG